MNDIIYKAYNTLQLILHDYMKDINPQRASTNQRFVYPTLPTSLDDIYPRLTIKLDEITPVPVGASNVVCFKDKERVFGINFSLLFRIMIFIKKETIYPIEIDGKSFKAKNELLTQNLSKLCYLSLFNAINDGRFNRDGFWINTIADVSITPGNFEFDTHRIASEVSIRINGIETTQQLFGDDELINKINNTVNVLMDITA